MVYEKVVYGKKSNANHLREQERNAYNEDCSQLIIIDGANSTCEIYFR